MSDKRIQDLFMVSIDTRKFRMKPTGKETGAITNRIVKHPKQISLKELVNEIKNGKTYLPCKLKDGKRKAKENWESQNLIVLDIDEGMTIEEALEHDFICSNASFLHTTFSHTEAQHKFRIVFALNRIVSDEREYDAIIGILYKYIPQADKACKDRARLFYGGKEIYWIDEKNRLNVDEIVIESLKGDKKEYLDISPQSISPSASLKLQSKLQNSIQIEAIKSKDIITLQNILKTNETILKKSEIVDYLKKIPLYIYLGIESYKSFHDIFHNEDNPSASIYLSNKNTGHWLYKCFSHSKHFCGTIIEVTMELQNCNREEAIYFLKSVFKIKIENCISINYFENLYTYYLEYMQGNNMSSQYPELYKLLTKSKALGILIQLLAFVQKDINETGTEIECYYSLETLSKYLGCSKSQLDKKINLFTLLGFCRKSNDEAIGEELLKRLKEKQKNSNRKYRSTVYKFDILGVELLEKANEIAKIFNENKLTLNSISYEGIYRSFGKETANEVFPQDINKEISQEHDEHAMQFVKAIQELIELKGWATQQEVIENVDLGRKFSKAKKGDIFKIVIKQIIDDYDLEYVQLMKDMKIEMQIDEAMLSKSSFPKIIRKRIS